MSDMREDLSAALDSLDTQDEMDETPQEVVQPDVEAEARTEETDESVEAAADKEEKTEGAEDGGVTASHADNPDSAPSDPKKGQSLKAPVGWKPQEREQWSKIPRPLQERILEREKEMSQHMAGTSQARQI
jgi:hypothetical protein